MIYTFYSFKGGVGRSMAMAACGCLFAKRGLRTLVLDFDLEAPGLERYFFADSTQLDEVRANPGLIDLVLAYKRALTNETEFRRAEFRDWRKFVVDAIPRTGRGGSVDLMTAGRRSPATAYSDYALAVRSFDWHDFFHNWRGDQFFAWLRREISEGKHGYDVVLVDSRTGVTEMGGICAYQLADLAVLLCATNYQNLDGTRAVMDDFRSNGVTALRGGRPLDLLVIPARVEAANDDTISSQRERFYSDFERLFGSDGMPPTLAEVGLDYKKLALPYLPEFAIIERLVESAADAPDLQSFERLTDALTLLAHPGTADRWTELKKDAERSLTGPGVPAPKLTVADTTKRGAGYDVMLECSPRNCQEVAELEQALSQRGTSVWFDRRAIDDADNFRSQLARALEYSAALVVCIGSAGPRPWHWTALQHAERRRKPIVPVILPECRDPSAALDLFGLSGRPFVRLQSGPKAALDASVLLEQLNALAKSGTASQLIESVSPYPGAAAFTEDRESYFFARDGEVTTLLALLEQNDVVVVSGPSAVGKTSLVAAGLLPRVRRGETPFAPIGNKPWTVRHLDFARWPLAADTLARPDEAMLFVIDGIDSFPQLGDDAAGWNQRIKEVERRLDFNSRRAKYVLLWRAAMTASERHEAMARWSRPGRSIATFEVRPLELTALRRVVEAPASECGHIFEPGLVDRILSDAGAQPGAVAQIQLVLSDLWASRRRGWLTNKGYDELGGIGKAYSQRVATKLASLANPQRTAALSLLLNLVQLDSQLRTFVEAREWEPLATIPKIQTSDAIALRDQLVEARLIEIERRPNSPLTCSLAHRDPGDSLRRALHDDRLFVRWRHRFSTYVRNPAGNTEVIAGPVLEEASRWLEQRRDDLTADESRLIERSKRAQSVGDVREHELTVVVITGAGARGAYEAGALSVLLPTLVGDLGSVILLGTSSGAINAALCASLARGNAPESGARIANYWRKLTQEQVFGNPLLELPSLAKRTTIDTFHFLASTLNSLAIAGLRMLGDAVTGHFPQLGEVVSALAKPVAECASPLQTLLDSPIGTVTGLLDTRPLAKTLQESIDMDALHHNIERGFVRGVGVVTTHCPTDGTRGRSRVFLELSPSAEHLLPERAVAIDYVRTKLGIQHLLASAAIPIAFPTVKIGDSDCDGWYTDGGLSLNSPLTPAIALGATRIILVTSHPTSYPDPNCAVGSSGSPDILDLSTRSVHAVLADGMVEDLRRIRRTNRMVAAARSSGTALEAEDGRFYRELEIIEVSPPNGLLSSCAAQTLETNPAQVATSWLSLVFAKRDHSNSEWLSYLLFDPHYHNQLLQLGAEHARAVLEQFPAALRTSDAALRDTEVGE